MKRRLAGSFRLDSERFRPIDGSFLATRRSRSPRNPVVSAAEPLTVDGLLHTVPPGEARLAEASEAQLTDAEDDDDYGDERAVPPLTPLADIPADHLGERAVRASASHYTCLIRSFASLALVVASDGGDLETAQSDPETTEEDMACAGPSGPRLSVRRARSRRRPSSVSESNLTGQQAEPT